MRAVLLAGGNGKRLYPCTAGINKHLMPIYNKPMIYFPLATLIEAGFREILLVSGARHRPAFRQLLGSGSLRFSQIFRYFSFYRKFVYVELNLIVV